MIRTRILVALAAVCLPILVAAAVIVFFQWRFDTDEEPTLTIEASDPGATTSAVERTIAIPIEQQISGVEHLRQLHSHSRRDGSYTLIASFAAGTDLNLAQVLVQNRVALALPILPKETQRLGVTLFKRSPDPLMFIVLFSPDGSRDTSYLVNYATHSAQGRTGSPAWCRPGLTRRPSRFRCTRQAGPGKTCGPQPHLRRRDPGLETARRRSSR